MSSAEEELQDRLEEQREEIELLKEAADRQKIEFEERLKEESYDAKVEKYNKLYKEAFGTDPPALLQFSQVPTPTPSPTPNPEQDQGQEQSEYDKRLTSEFEEEIPRDELHPTGDDIPQPMADCLQRWFRTIHSGHDILETLKLCTRPANATSLKTVKLNEEVAKKLDRPDEIKDNRMRWLCNALSKTVQPLTKVWASLKDLEFELQQAQPADQDVTDAMVPIMPDRSLNLSEVIRDLKLGIKCLGMAHVQSIQKRRWDLKDKLQGAAKELAKPNQPFDDELFGSDMEKRVNKIIAANKVTAKLTKSPAKNFLARGHGKCGGSCGSHYRYNQQRNHFQPPNQWQGNQYPQYQFPQNMQSGNYFNPHYPPPQQGPPPAKRG